MKSLRSYLYVPIEQGDWAATTYRELEALEYAVLKTLSTPGMSAAIHVGFWRPETSSVLKLAERYPGRVIVSESAFGAFPPSFGLRRGAIPVGEAEGVKFHLALSGFAYAIDDPDARIVDHEASLSAQVGPSKHARGWVAKIIEVAPDLAPPLGQAGIWDEDSYLASEHLLEPALRARVGLDRFVALTSQAPSEANIINCLHACPPWFLALALSNLEMTVRQRNVMTANSISTVRQLSDLGYNGLARLQSLGKGSIHGLAKLLHEAFLQNRGLSAVSSANGPAHRRALAIAHSGELSSLEANLILANARAAEPPTFIAGLTRIVDNLGTHSGGLWASRIGFGCDPMTLQAISQNLSVTRERVRQIEAKIYGKVKSDPLWVHLSDRLDAALADRTSSLLVAGLSAIDPWFEGVERHTHAFKTVLEHLLAGGFHAFPIDGTEVVSRLSQHDWRSAVQDGRDLLTNSVSDEIDKTQARFLIDSLLVSKGEELRDDLWAECSAGATWTSTPGRPPTLSGFFGSAEDTVIAILNSSDRPMRIDEVRERSIALGATDHGLGYLRNALGGAAFLYGRSTFGLMKHCPLSTEQMDMVRAEVEDVINGAEQSRQWHCSELHQELQERGLDFDGVLTKYLINIALKKSTCLSDLRRMVWGQKDNWVAGRSSRLDVKQAVIALLETKGEPMSTAELRERLLADRGVNSTFQIHPSPPLFRMGWGMWGLLGRDDDTDSATLRDALGELTARLDTLQHGLHMSEIPSALARPALREGSALHALMALAKPTGIHVDPSQYAYLVAWKSSRRLSVPEALSLALNENAAGGATHDTLWKRVCDLTKREIPRTTVSAVLQGLDAERDPISALWRPASSQLEEEMQDT